MLRLTVRSVDSMLANGSLPHLKLGGGAIRFTAKQLQDALKTFTVDGRPQLSPQVATKPKHHSGKAGRSLVKTETNGRTD